MRTSHAIRREPASSERRLTFFSPRARAGIASASLTVAALAIVFLPVPWCPWAALAHVPCPGCGLTRATLAALRGDLRASFHYHPLAMVLTPTLVIMLLRDLHGYVRRGVWGAGQRGGRLATAFTGALAAAMIAVWLARFFGLFGGPVAVS